MDINEILYKIEHEQLPKWFFKDQGEFVLTLISPQFTTLFDLINNTCKKEGVENPYTVEDIKIVSHDFDSEIIMVKIIMPKPEAQGLCTSIYMFFDDCFQAPGFYTVELGDGDSKLIYSWDKRCRQTFLAEAPDMDKEEMLYILEQYMKTYFY